MLKKITKDLPLHSIVLAVKWEYLSDLKLADYDFRTPARIALLLRAEVIASILRESRRASWTSRHPLLILALDGCYLARLMEPM